MDNTEKIAACTLWDDHNIKGFFGEYRWLSNFHKEPILYKGAVYGSTEAAYMAAKCKNSADRKQFENLEPKDAKKVGRTVELRDDWEFVKDEVMYEVNLFKYSYYQNLRDSLLATGDKYIEETNWWNDKYWGVCNGEGVNMLGNVLMTIRTQLKKLQK